MCSHEYGNFSNQNKVLKGDLWAPADFVLKTLKYTVDMPKASIVLKLAWK